MYIYMCVHENAQQKKTLVKSFIFKMLALGLMEELMGITNWLHEKQRP